MKYRKGFYCILSIALSMVMMFFMDIEVSADTEPIWEVVSNLSNGDFEMYDNSTWQPTDWTQAGDQIYYLGQGWSKDDPGASGNMFMNTTWGIGGTYHITQEVTLSAGTYKLLGYYAAANDAAAETYLYVTENDTTHKAIIGASDTWLPTETESFTLSTETVVTVGVHVEYSDANYWANVDSLEILKQKETQEEDKDTGNNLLPLNASFEEYVDSTNWNVPKDWTIEGTTGASYMDWPYDEDTPLAYDGTAVMSTYAVSDYQANVYQTVENLEPGYYYLTAYAKRWGNHKECYLYGYGTNQSKSMTSIPLDLLEKNDWKLITVRGIYVGEDGKATIGFYVDGNGGDSMQLDSIALHREKNQDSQYRLLKGGDVSMLTYVEDDGGEYYDESGNAGDCLQLLADNGFDIARLRLYNSPGKGKGDGTYYCPEGYQTPEDILNQARRAKEKGMQIQLSFHYSDYWTNGATQIIPSDWQPELENLDTAAAVAKLEELVYEYTKDFLQKMKAQGTSPEYISFGNEMQSGILFPYGKTTNDCWPSLARFLNAAYQAAEEVCPDARVILHLDDAGNDWKYNNFFDNCKTYGVNYDIIGASYYPFWTNLDVDAIVAFCNNLVERYDRDIMIMETGFNFTPYLENGELGQLNHSGPYGTENTPRQQREFMIELFNGLKSVTDGRVIGDLYWDPIFINTENTGWALVEATDESDGNYVYNTTLFGYDNQLLPVMDAYRYNRESKSTYGYLSGKIAGDDGKGIRNISAVLTIGGNSYDVSTDAYGEFRIAVPAGNHQITSVDAAGLQWTEDNKTLVMQKNETTKTVLTMTGVEIYGSVKDMEGQEVTNAVVTVSGDNGLKYTEMVDSSGAYRFTGLGAASYTIAVQAEGYTIDENTKTTGNLQIGSKQEVNFTAVLTSGSASGLVTDKDGKGLKDVLVTASAGSHTVTCKTGSDGFYQLACLNQDERYKITYLLAGYVDVEKEVLAVAGNHTQLETVILEQNVGSVSGIVTAAGKEAEGIEVKLSDGRSAVTDAEGKFSFEQVGTGRVIVNVSGNEEVLGMTGTGTVEFQKNLELKIDLPERIELINPGFYDPTLPDYEGYEKDNGGWDMGGSSNASYNAYQYQWRDADYDGNHYNFAFWLDDPFEAWVSQKVENLDAGAYILRIQSYAAITGVYEMFVKDEEGNDIARISMESSPNGFSARELEFEIKDPGSYVIGFYTDTASGDWAVLDYAELGYWGIASKSEETPKPEITPEPEETSKPEITPKPEETPKPEKTPKPEITPKPEETSKPENTPNTGDDSHVLLWAGLLLVAMAGLLLAVITRKRRVY